MTTVPVQYYCCTAEYDRSLRVTREVTREVQSVFSVLEDKRSGCDNVLVRFSNSKDETESYLSTLYDNMDCLMAPIRGCYRNRRYDPPFHTTYGRFALS